MFQEIILVFALVGAFQSGLLSIGLFFWRRNREVNRIFGLFLLLVSVQALVFYLQERFQIIDYDIRYFIRVIPFTLPALLYYYAMRVLGKRPGIKYLLHGLPALAYFSVMIAFYTSDTAFLRLIKPLFGVLGRELMSALLLTYYFILFRKFSSNQNHKTARAEIDIRWLTSIFNFYLLISFISVLFAVFLQFPPFAVHFNPFVVVHLLNAFFLYWISYQTLTQPRIFYSQEGKHEIFNPSYEKYQRTSISNEQSRAVAKRLKEHFESSRQYLNPELKLDVLATSMKLNRNQLSQVINNEMGQSFNTFVNSYRIRDARQMLADPLRQHQTISAIAFEAGFNSLATFNRIFKDATGITPGDFREKNTPQITG